MRKKEKKARKKIAKNSSWKIILTFFLFVVLGVFLFSNIYYSQNLSPLFISLAKGNDYQSVVSYLKKIEGTKYFPGELKKYQRLYGDRLLNDVFAERVKIEKTIKEFERWLRFNPDSRDLLYWLYRLNKMIGREEKAKEYLKKVREIDPKIEEITPSDK